MDANCGCGVLPIYAYWSPSDSGMVWTFIVSEIFPNTLSTVGPLRTKTAVAAGFKVQPPSKVELIFVQLGDNM